MVLGLLDFYANRDFYAKPDGEALAEKIICSTEIPVVSSIFLGLGDVLAAQKNAFGLYTFQRMLQRFIPLQCMALMFTVTTHAVARIRKKDDACNHAIGALTALTVVRAYLPLQTTIVAGCVLVPGAIMSKSVADDPLINRQVGTLIPRDEALCLPTWSQLKTLSTDFIKYD